MRARLVVFLILFCTIQPFPQQEDFQKFIDIGGHFYFSDTRNPMHNKFCVIDNKVLINGSYNWTYYAEDRNRENILILKIFYKMYVK